jgi:hypothetical protein
MGACAYRARALPSWSPSKWSRPGLKTIQIQMFARMELTEKANWRTPEMVPKQIINGMRNPQAPKPKEPLSSADEDGRENHAVRSSELHIGANSGLMRRCKGKLVHI